MGCLLAGGGMGSSYALGYLVAIPSALDTHKHKARSTLFFNSGGLV